MIDLPTIRRLGKRPPVTLDSSIADLDDAALEERIRMVAHLKRFFECYCGDPEFRAAAQADIRAALEDRGLVVSFEDASQFLAANQGSERFEWTANLRAYRDFLLELHGGYEMIATAAESSNRRYAAWRARQLARLRFEFSAVGDYVIRPAAAFELSKGCSAGCWFCAISAGRLESNFDYSSGSNLWRGVLGELSRILGRSAASSFCYWATDPLDNESYENFASDFCDTLGAFPPTTTALALKNAARTRALLRLSYRSGCRLNRFSVLTTPMLRRIHRDFSPEELVLVDLVPQNPGALVFTDFPHTQPGVKIRAGRVLENSGEAVKRNATTVAGTIACITGFLVNMIDGSIQLVSPCMATPEWPLGYRIHGRRQFGTAEEFGCAVEDLIASHMAEELPDSKPLRFRSDLQYTSLNDGFRISTPLHAVEFRDRLDSRQAGIYRQSGDAIRTGTHTAREIEQFSNNLSGEIRAVLESIYNSGALDDAPGAAPELPPFMSPETGSPALVSISGHQS